MAGLHVYASRLDTHTYSALTTFSATQGDGAVISKGVDPYGTGRTRPVQYLDRGDTITSVPQYFGSQVKSICLHLLISWHFISPKCIFYCNVDKQASASASGGLCPPYALLWLCPWIPMGDLRPLETLLFPPNRGLDTDRCHW